MRAGTHSTKSTKTAASSGTFFHVRDRITTGLASSFANDVSNSSSHASQRRRVLGRCVSQRSQPHRMHVASASRWQTVHVWGASRNGGMNDAPACRRRLSQGSRIERARSYPCALPRPWSESSWKGCTPMIRLPQGGTLHAKMPKLCRAARISPSRDIDDLWILRQPGHQKAHDSAPVWSSQRRSR